MIIPKGLTKDEKLAFFQDLYTEARNSAEEIYEKMQTSLEQYKGSKKIDGSEEEAKAIRNITYELIESQVSSYIPNPAVKPKMWSEKNERNAKSIETMLCNKRDELPYEKHNDMDERFNPIYGGSVWLPEWDNSIVTHHTVGDINLTCMSPKHFTGQPCIYDTKDMEYCFAEFETTKEDIMRKYGVSVEVAEDTESDENADDKTATLYVCYYKNADDKVCQFIWSGDTTLSDIEDYYARKRKICKICGTREELCECEKPKFVLHNEDYEELDHDITLSDGSIIPAISVVIENGQIVAETVQKQAVTPDGQLVFDNIGGVMIPKMIDVQVPKTEPTRIPFYKPNILPVVIRKNTSEEDSLFGQSDCEFIRPQQQAINKVETRILEKLIGAGVYPLVPDDFQEDLDNSVFKRVFKVKNGQVGMYGRVDLQVDISFDIAHSDRLYDQAKRILGISDSFQGQYDGSAQSGVAKQLQIQQSAGRLDSKRQMKNAAHAEIDKIIFQFYLAYADEPRPATYKDSEGRMQNCTFNRYDFLERDENGKYYYNDEYLFSTDTTVDLERSRTVLWQENRQNFQQGAYGDPTLPQTQLIFWLNMEKAHYPWAHDNVERIREEFVNGVTANEYTHPSKHIDDDLYTAKMRASTELDNLIDAGFNFRMSADGRDGHIHASAVGGFSYFDVIFGVTNEYYQGVINIENNRRGKRLKDITKIENITKDVTSQYGNNPTYAFLRDASMDSIHEENEKSNPSDEKTSKKVSTNSGERMALPDGVEVESIDTSSSIGKKRQTYKASLKERIFTAADSIYIDTVDEYYGAEKYLRKIGKRKDTDSIVQAVRASMSAAQTMTGDVQYDIFSDDGKKLGEGLSKIVKPITVKGDAIKISFNEYLMHWLNVDRMSLDAQKIKQTSRFILAACLFFLILRRKCLCRFSCTQRGK